MKSLLRLPWILLAVALLVAVVIVTARKNSSELAAPQQAFGKSADTPPEVTSLKYLAPQIESVERPPYIGPDACAECHRNIHGTFVKTKHPRTLREVKVADMPATILEPHNAFQMKDGRVRFEMLKQQDRFFQSATEQLPQGVRETRSTVDLVLGAGGVADDVFLTWNSEGWMRELPLAWLYPTQESACSHFDPNSGGDFGRLLTTRCVECHSTWVHHVPGTANQYHREGRILGVTCESCHGPGKRHAHHHKNNPQDTLAQHIVVPSKLERERQIEVCTQCHSNAMKHLGPAFSYRPGLSLDQHYKTVVTKATEDDRVANQITYLRQSKCFIDDSTMTCTTCHNPHVANSELNSGSATCSKCHEPKSCKDRGNLPEAVQVNCVGCHMPSYLKININFQTKDSDYVPPLRRTEHRIASYEYAKNEVLLQHFEQLTDEASRQRTLELRAALVQHFEQESVSCRSNYRYLGAVAALREVVRIEDTPEARQRLNEAIQFQSDLDKLATDAQRQLLDNQPSVALETYQKILAVKPNDANAHGRLGTEYARTGNRAKAIEHWTAVAQHDPNDAYGLGMLAWQAFLERRESEALEFYRQAEAIEPRQSKMKYQIGLVLTRLGRLPEAVEKFKEAVDIEPQNAEAIQAVVLAALEAGMPQDAIPYAEYVVRASQLKDAGSLNMLASVYESAGYTAQALDALHIALPHAANSELKKEIESRIAKLKSASN